MATQIISLPYGWHSKLIAKLEAADPTLPLPDSDLASLKVLLAGGKHSYLVLRGPAAVEVVRVEFDAGLLSFVRGIDSTGVQTFPKGASVCAEVVPALVKDLVCAFDCCEGDCDCIEPTVAGKNYPASVSTGSLFEAIVVFAGDMPMSVATSPAPPWLTVTVGPNYAHLSGTPAVVGNYSIAVSATNCGGALVSEVVAFAVV